MLTIEKLLELNNQGFIPGPEETEDVFLKRVSLTKKFFEDPAKIFEEKEKKAPFALTDRLKEPDRHWAKNSLLHSFDISAQYFSAYFNNEKLKIFQGAATWLLDIDDVSLPILQLRKSLKKGSFLKIYEMEDILAHELAHFARAGFNEPKFEEFFAYFTSSRTVRKILGPIASSSKEIILFLTFLFLSLGAQYLGFFFKNKIFDFLFVTFSLSSAFILSLGLIRLSYRRWAFNRCFKKLLSIFKTKKKTMSVMFRLTDKEIKKFAKTSTESINKYIEENKDNSLRWKVIYKAYFF